VLFLTREHSEKNERADENGSSPTPLDPFAPITMHNLTGCRNIRHPRARD